MVERNRFKKASQKEISLYTFIGESLCAVQILEDALSHSIVLKKTEPEQKIEADKLLEKQRSCTLGRAIRIVKEESLLPKSLEKELSEILTERNWLIHKSIVHNIIELESDYSRTKLIHRIKNIAIKAHNLQILIEEDLFEYVENKGIDMSRVKAEIDKYYSK